MKQSAMVPPSSLALPYRLQLRSMALYRGYQGNWAIARSKLWLTAQGATVRQHSSRVDSTHGERGLDWLFPGTSGPVLADWYTGEVVTGMGGGARVAQFAWDWQRYRVFTIDRGEVVGIAVRDNTKAFREGVARYKRFSQMLDRLGNCSDIEVPDFLKKKPDTHGAIGTLSGIPDDT